MEHTGKDCDWEQRILDVEWLACGYLRSTTGRIRHIPGIERLGREAQRAGARLIWTELPGLIPGACVCTVGIILLAAWIFDADPWVVRDTLSHELGHVLMGPSEEHAAVWQTLEYGDLIEPPDWGVW